MVDQTKNARHEVEVIEIDLQKSIEKSIHKFESLTGFNQIEILTDSTYSVPFYSDPYRVEVILNSILLNSIKYADLKKVQPYIHIQVSQLKNNIILKISDNGIGIDEKNMPNIYNMFYRASEKSDGAGLGLYLVKEFTEKLRGSVHIESTLHAGTIVEVALPNLYKI